MTAFCGQCGTAVEPSQSFCRECGAETPATPNARPAAPQIRQVGQNEVGRTCPYCRFPLKSGGPAATCPTCRATHHEDCWRDNGGCAVAGCVSGPRASPLQARPPVAPAGGPATGQLPPLTNRTATPIILEGNAGAGPTGPGFPPQPPPALPGARPRSSVWTALLIAVLAVAAVGIGTVFLSSHGSTNPTSTATSSFSTPPPTSTPTQPRPTGPARPAPRSTGVTGRDDAGFNQGPSCSDNPGSSLPGCGDSPSPTPGDPEGSCSHGIIIDRQTTSCGLAESVYSNYQSDGSVAGFSPERGRSYTFTCQTGGGRGQPALSSARDTPAIAFSTSGGTLSRSSEPRPLPLACASWPLGCNFPFPGWRARTKWL